MFHIWSLKIRCNRKSWKFLKTKQPWVFSGNIECIILTVIGAWPLIDITVYDARYRSRGHYVVSTACCPRVERALRYTRPAVGSGHDLWYGRDKAGNCTTQPSVGSRYQFRAVFMLAGAVQDWHAYSSSFWCTVPSRSQEHSGWWPKKRH
jgi:hypothetical protein